MTKRINISDIKKSKGNTNWQYLKQATDELLPSSYAPELKLHQLNEMKPIKQNQET